MNKKWMVVAVGIFAVVTLVLVAVGVTTHKEAGLLRACWAADGSARYDAKDCPSEDVAWPRETFPLDVSVSLYSADAEEQQRADRIVEHAIDGWNSQLGFRAFRKADATADVVLTWGLPAESGAPREGGVVKHTKVRGGMRASVDIVSHGIDEFISRVVFHELGHVIGLAHDDFASSPMYPTTREGTLSGDSPGQGRVTDFDRALLRRLYVRD